MKSVLITGICGFVGSHLCNYYCDLGYNIIGIDRPGNGLERFQCLFGSSKKFQQIKVFHTNLYDIAEIKKFLQNHNVDFIVHLAGEAFPPAGWKDPAAILRNNTLCTVNILQAARDSGWKGRFLYISSGDVYGNDSKLNLPLTEKASLFPEGPYAFSKHAAEQFSIIFNRNGIDVIIARPFNHIGPGQKIDFVVPALLNRIEEAISVGSKKIIMGDLSSGRDFTDVRDVVQAYDLLLEKGIAGEIYNVCSGKLVTIREVFSLCLNVCGVNLDYETDEALLRPEGTTMRYGSVEKLKQLGWEPRYSLEESIADTRRFMNKEKTK